MMRVCHRLRGVVAIGSLWGALLVFQAHAQAIEIKAQEFKPEAPALPFAKPANAPAAAALEPAARAGTTTRADMVRLWEIRLQDVNLATTFSRWAAESGWRVRWDARKHILVEAPDRITGSFEDAVTAVLEGPGIAGSAYPLEVCFYPNQPRLARITRKGEQDKECL